VWSLERDEERVGRRRLLEELAATDLPAGFAKALQRLERLARRQSA
jgi:hypothetical protein